MVVLLRKSPSARRLRYRLFMALYCLAILVACILAGEAHGQTGPVTGKEPEKDRERIMDDPLLREDWIQAEAKRARGLTSRLAMLLEKPTSRMVVRDFARRKYQLDFSGKLTFNPYDDNWKPVIPRVSAAPFHQAEAEALAAKGLVLDALALWKSMQAMARFAPRPPAQVTRSARVASVRINRLRNERDEFELMDFITDPYIFYDDRFDFTVLLSDVHGWRIVLPGAWKYVRGKDDFTTPRKTGLTRTLAYLKQGDITITVGSDLFNHAYRIPRLAGYISVWDTRRSLSTQRKQFLDFTRAEHALQGEYCSATGRIAERAGANSRRYRRYENEVKRRRPLEIACMLADSSLQAPERRSINSEVYRFERGKDKAIPKLPARRKLNFVEFYHLRPTHGFYLGIRYRDKDRSVVSRQLGQILNRIHFSSP